MSEPKCPNCSSDDSRWHIGWDKGGPVIRHCRECGAQWQEGYPEGVVIPRRSQPCEPKELPDAEGWWWYRLPGHGWTTTLVTERSILDTYLHGEYVPAVPPIVKPREVRDADAELLRNLAHCFSHAGGHGYDSGRRTPKSQDLERIADRLDKLARLELKENVT